MTGHELFPLSSCADPAGTPVFPDRVLHAVQIYRFPGEGAPDFLVPRVGDGRLGLDVGSTAALHGDTPLPATGHAVQLCVCVEDLPAVVEAARRSGAAVPAGAMPWGGTAACVHDPGGTMLAVVRSGAGPEGPTS